MRVDHETGSRLQAHEITDRDEWNRTLLALGPAHLRQGWEWTTLRGGTVYRYVGFADEHPVAALAATAIGCPGVPGAMLYASRGPVLDRTSPAAAAALSAAVAGIAARTRAVFLRMSPGIAVEDDRIRASIAEAGGVALDDLWTAWNAPRVVMLLDLAGTEVDLKRRMRDSTRLSLSKAEKQGATVVRSTDADALERFHRLLTVEGRRLRYPVRPLAFFEGLRQHYLARDAGTLVLASYGGRDVAGVLGVRFGDTTHLLYSAVDHESRALRAGMSVHWHLIRWARQQGCVRMDWGGSVTGWPPAPTDAGYGIYEFKRGFGCQVQLLSPYYDVVFRPGLYRIARLLERRAGLLLRLRARFN
jgi:lipid II:glycine glycyltransferase (peptidoglycan interpeptide bridge formation enzyme)